MITKQGFETRSTDDTLMTSRIAKTRRRIIRFSVRSLLLVVLVVGCFLSWFSSKTRYYVRQQAAVSEIRRQGGNVTFRYQQGKNGPPPLPPKLVQWFIGDVVMSDVVKVSLHAPLAANDDMSAFRDLATVEDLRLNARRLTDDGIGPISALKRLRRLDVWCPRITDQGIQHLSGLTNIRQLDLSSTNVGDQGIQVLGQLSKMKKLKVRDTRVTSGGAATLQATLPKCQVLGVKPSAAARNSSI